MVVRTPPPSAHTRRTRTRDDGTRYTVRLQRALRAFGVRLPRLRRELARYAAVHTDRVRGAVRRAAIAAAIGALGATVALALLATAVVLLVSGIAGGLAAAFGGIPWLGDLVGGAAVLLTIGAVIVVALRRDRVKRMHTLMARYAKFDEPRPTPVVGRNGETGPARTEEPARPAVVRS